MNKLAIIDVDNVICDNTARFAKAEEARQKYFETEKAKYEEIFHPTKHSFDSTALAPYANNLYWQTAFTPELVSLDTLIDGVGEALASIKYQGYSIILLTSRPESMRCATMHWLLNNGLWESYNTLIMKAPAFCQPPPNHTKTTVWKAGMVQTLAIFYGASSVLFIDDEEANRVEIAKYERSYELAFACSMADALTVIHMP